MRIDAQSLDYRTLNERINDAVGEGETEFELQNVLGHRYIGAGLGNGVRISIEGTPGNDLAAFMNGADLTVHGNAQDATGNTMNEGRVVVHGHAGDLPAHSMRGGRILVRGRVGYRAGIHMKAFREHFPVLVAGETAGDYAGEYMAGGVVVVLNLSEQRESPVGMCLGTGMHAGTIYVRGSVEPHQLGEELGQEEISDDDADLLNDIISEYEERLDMDVDISPGEFLKFVPTTSRPYGKLYAY
jgi:glutamate synthase domain-containing protein 3